MKTMPWAAVLLTLQGAVLPAIAEAKTLFADDFEAGDTVCWSSTVGMEQFGTVACQKITAVSSDPAVPGADVTITGTGFGASQGVSQVRYDGQPLAVGSWSGTSIVATLPSPKVNGIHALGVVVSGRTVTVEHAIENLVAQLASVRDAVRTALADPVIRVELRAVVARSPTTALVIGTVGEPYDDARPFTVTYDAVAGTWGSFLLRNCFPEDTWCEGWGKQRSGGYLTGRGPHGYVWALDSADPTPMPDLSAGGPGELNEVGGMTSGGVAYGTTAGGQGFLWPLGAQDVTPVATLGTSLSGVLAGADAPAGHFYGQAVTVLAPDDRDAARWNEDGQSVEPLFDVGPYDLLIGASADDTCASGTQGGSPDFTDALYCDGSLRTIDDADSPGTQPKGFVHFVERDGGFVVAGGGSGYDGTPSEPSSGKLILGNGSTFTAYSLQQYVGTGYPGAIGGYGLASGAIAEVRDAALTPSAVFAISQGDDALLFVIPRQISHGVTTCAPVEVAAFHGGGFPGNARLAKIENDHVPCVQMDLGTPASCAFFPETGRASGEWLESPEGDFALVGQAIALDGTPDGEYVIAARVSEASPAACVESAGMDTVGRLEEGTEFGTTCTIEDLLTPYNALSAQYGWTPLLNVANREICTSTHPHPDGAYLVRSYPRSGSGPDDTFCYQGTGAALNDTYGIERDGLGGYYLGEEYCHYIQTGGYEMPAAKRPATFSYPAPGGLNTQSPILWRPVSPGFDIANDDGLANVQTLEDKQQFIAATGASTATGALPDLGQVASRTTIGAVTFSLALGGNSLSIGTVGTGAEPDYYPALPGNDIALGYENLQVQTATPVYSLGFDFVEPNTTMPSYGGTPVDSTFDVVLYSGSTEVGRASFNAPDDEVAFVGVWSERAFDRATIVDRTGSADDEFFGQFYTGPSPRP